MTATASKSSTSSKVEYSNDEKNEYLAMLLHGLRRERSDDGYKFISDEGLIYELDYMSIIVYDEIVEEAFLQTFKKIHTRVTCDDYGTHRAYHLSMAGLQKMVHQTPWFSSFK